MLLDYERFVHKPVERRPAPTPVVTRERIDPAYAAKRALGRAAEATLQIAADVARPPEKSWWEKRYKTKAATLARIREEFPPQSESRRHCWYELARYTLRHPYRSLLYAGRRFGMDHSSIIHALQTMGIYEDRNSREFLEGRRRHKLYLHRKRQNWNAARRARNAESKVLRERAFGSARVCRSKLCASDIPAIRRLCAEGVPRKVIARQYGVHWSVIQRVNTRRLWKHIP